MIYQPREIEVFHDLCLVRRIDTTKTPGGLIIPYHPNKKESNLAKVVQVGSGVVGKPETVPQCSPGEFWLVARYIGTVITINGRDHTLVKWIDMQARITFDDEAIKLLDDALEDAEKDTGERVAARG